MIGNEIQRKLKDRLDNFVSIIDSEEIDFNGTSANSSGYKSVEVTIPAGCIAVGCVSTGSVANARGLQVSIIYCGIIDNSTRARDYTTNAFMTYFAPQAITSTAKVKLRYLCFKVK